MERKKLKKALIFFVSAPAGIFNFKVCIQSSERSINYQDKAKGQS